MRGSTCVLSQLVAPSRQRGLAAVVTSAIVAAGLSAVAATRATAAHLAAAPAANDAVVHQLPNRDVPTQAPTYRPVRASSVAAAQAPAAGELPGLRTAFSRSYADGALVRAVVAPRPVNYRDAAGVWQPIDTTLTRSASADGRAVPAGYAWQNTAGEYAVALPADLGAAPVQVRVGSVKVELALVGARGAGRAVGNTATYGDVLPGVDAAYAAEPDGVKETLTLAGPASPSTFTFALTTSAGVVPSLTEEGDVALAAGAGGWAACRRRS